MVAGIAGSIARAVTEMPGRPVLTAAQVPPASRVLKTPPKSGHPSGGGLIPAFFSVVPIGRFRCVDRARAARIDGEPLECGARETRIDRGPVVSTVGALEDAVATEGPGIQGGRYRRVQCAPPSVVLNTRLGVPSGAMPSVLSADCTPR